MSKVKIARAPVLLMLRTALFYSHCSFALKLLPSNRVIFFFCLAYWARGVVRRFFSNLLGTLLLQRSLTSQVLGDRKSLICSTNFGDYFFVVTEQEKRFVIDHIDIAAHNTYYALFVDICVQVQKNNVHPG